MSDRYAPMLAFTVALTVFLGGLALSGWYIPLGELAAWVLVVIAATGLVVLLLEWLAGRVQRG